MTGIAAVRTPNGRVLAMMPHPVMSNCSVYQIRYSSY